MQHHARLMDTRVVHKTKYLRLCAMNFYLCNRTGVLVAKEVNNPGLPGGHKRDVASGGVELLRQSLGFAKLDFSDLLEILHSL